MYFQCPESQLPPTEMDQLDPLEVDLVLCFRRWVLGLCKSDPRHWSVAWNDLAKLLGGKDARFAASGLNAMIMEICGSARRHIRHHPPCCRYICGDELAVLSLVSACQRREVARARAVAGWLVLEDGVDGLFCAAMRVAAALAAQGCVLPDRTLAAAQTSAGAPAEPDRPRLVH